MKKFNEYFDNNAYSKILVIGIPSGEVLFLTKQQLNFLIGRDYLTYKKSLNGVKIEKYCFNDEHIRDIKYFLDVIEWH